MVAETWQKDDAGASASYFALPTGGVVFGGSEPSTSDEVRFSVVGLDSACMPDSLSWLTLPTPLLFTNPTPPPTLFISQWWDAGAVKGGGTTWKVTLTVTADYPTYPGGDCECVNPVTGQLGGPVPSAPFQLDIGKRSDDIVLIGWIDAAQVPLSTTGVDADLLDVYPPSGPSPFKADECLANLGFLSWGITAFGTGGASWDLGDNPDHPNRTYWLNWQFKYTGNPDPLTVLEQSGGTADFRDPSDSYFDYARYQTYVDDKTNYKLVNRFQAKWYGGQTPGEPEALFNLRAEAMIGTTENPCGIAGAFPGQSGPKNETLYDLVTAGGWSKQGHINDGSPDVYGVRGFATLSSMGFDPEVYGRIYWENIGSKISWTPGIGAYAPGGSLQVYPTYYLFYNGSQGAVYPQAAEPKANFKPAPYPFGLDPCTNPVQPGGRCGDAESPASPGSGSPAFSVEN